MLFEDGLGNLGQDFKLMLRKILLANIHQSAMNDL